MSPLEHAACDEAQALRQALGMSQEQFAAQLGVHRRTVSRWEKHIFCPRREHLPRLTKLRRTLETLDTRDRTPATPLTFCDPERPPAPVRIQRKSVERLSGRLLSAVIRMCGDKKIRIPKSMVHGREPVVQLRLDPARGEYVAWVRTARKTA